MPRAPSFAARLLAWYDADHRDLPWRRTDDPWAIWVSEIMLQQTRVEAVTRHYERFLATYPTPAAFADATEDELLTAWRGLGYYRRARLLRDGAKVVAMSHAGAVPDDPKALAALPGIGAYTCGAVGSIAFGHAVPAVDGNVERVLARHRGIGDDVKKGAGARAVRDAATADLDRARPGDFNQAMMELGATVCTPTQPDCDACPVRRDCVARREDRTASLPVLPKRRAAIDVTPQAVVVPCGPGQVLGVRIAAGEINAGQVDLPGSGPLVSCDPADLPRLLRERHGLAIEVEGELGSVRHGITHHRIRLTAHWASPAPTRLRAPLLAAAPQDAAVPWTTLARKVFRLAGLDATETPG